MSSQTKKLRELLDNKKILALPGAYDAFSAKVIEKMGFEAGYITGYGIEASRLGRPDMGLASMSEVIDHATNIANTVNIPMICDADTGFGGLLNVMRTVESFQRAGIAGIHIEDQIIPKRCGGLNGKQNCSQKDLVDRIKVATSVREDKDFVIIGRSDAKGLGGVEEVKRRLYASLEAGADIVMIGDRYTVEEISDLASEFFGRFMMTVGFADCEEMNLSVKEYEEMGVKIINYAIVGLGAAGAGIRAVYSKLLNNGQITNDDLKELCMSAVDINKTLDIKKFLAIDKEYANR